MSATTGSGELDISNLVKQKQATQGGIGTGHHSESEISTSKKKIVRFGQGEGRSLEEDAEWSEPQVKDSGVDTGSSTTLNEEHNLASKVSWKLIFGKMMMNYITMDILSVAIAMGSDIHIIIIMHSIMLCIL